MRDDDAWRERDQRAIEREALAYKRERFEPMIATKEQTTDPRIELRLPADDYHAATDWLSNSMFKTFLEDPRLFEAEYITKSLPKKRTAAMDLGTVGHAAILEPHVIDDVCLEIPTTALNGDGHKKGTAWKEFAEAQAKRILLKPDEMKIVRGMFDACYRHPVARRLLLADGPCEASIFWTCPLSGIKRRVRPDKMVDGFGWVNVKTTTAGVDEQSFIRTVRNFRYDIGQEFYRDAGERIDGERPDHYFLVVEQDPPHRVRVYQLGQNWQSIARDTIEQGLLDFARRTEANDWSHESESRIFPID
jgi:exodeoxyribonuclease VIII